MALDLFLNKTESPTGTAARERSDYATAAGPSAVAYKVLHALASLKFTIVLFALAIFIVFTGTLAQTQHDIWFVIKNYFRVDLRSLFSKNVFDECFVFIPFDIFCIKLFFPESIWPNGPPHTEMGMWFPRGWLIGALMFINLLAAHTVRFSIQAKGTRLWSGLGVIVAGCLATWAAVASGSSSDGILGESMIHWSTVWKLVQLGLTATAFGAGAAFFLLQKHRIVERCTAAAVALSCGAIVAVTLFDKDMMPNPDAIRILWQLAKATGAGLILLVGCVMVFKKRAGIVLLHAGVGVMFAHEFVVGMWHKEAQMPIFEGTKSNWVHDIRHLELAIIEPGSTENKVTAIPDHLITKPGVVQSKRLDHLPFDIEIVKYMANSRSRPKGPFEPSDADSGDVGKTFQVVERPIVNGVTSSSESNLPAMFVKFTSKKEPKESLGTFLIGTEFWMRDWQFDELPAQSITVDGKTYQFELRHERIYKPYVIEAKEVKQDHYLGGKNEKTKSYSSLVHVVDKGLDVDRPELIRMNSPMRFADETFYQSGYAEFPHKMTTLSVVQNTGWMLPYVSCMIVAVGMLAQFGGSLLRFLGRQQKAGDDVVMLDESLEAVDERNESVVAKARRIEAAKKRKAKNFAAAEAVEAGPPSRWLTYGIPVAVLLMIGMLEARIVKAPKPDDRGMDLAAFGTLPVAYESRIKPMDALARNTMVDLLTKQTYKNDQKKDSTAPSRPAIRWFLDLSSNKNEVRELAMLDIDKEGIDNLPILRIDNNELVESLGIEPNLVMSYSWNQIFKKKRPADKSPTGTEIPEIMVQAGQAREKTDAGKTLDAREREAVKLFQRVTLFEAMRRAFENTGREIAAEKDLKADDSSLLIALLQITQRSAELEQNPKQPPKPVPLDDGTWLTVRDASLVRFMNKPELAGEMKKVEEQVRALPEKWKLVLADLDLQRRATRDRDELAEIEDKRRQVTTMQPSLAKLSKLFDVHSDPKKQLGAAGLKFLEVLDAYQAGNATAFNSHIAEYRELLAQNPPPDYDAGRRDWEAFLLRSEPFYWNAYMYLLAGCFAALAWLGFRKQFNRVSFWIITTAFVVHTLALILRMFVTERPPVTNLYSSAVFIGWGCVLLGIVLEGVFKNGFGNLVAAVAGWASLEIAWLLGRQGDTIESLEAVLDTTFWLATHVTCITLGYSTTFFAGVLGAAYILYGVATPKMTQDEGKMIARMTYGTLCFALFFSFVGTVLGGLWADDSWGRFWGWDPKENGALIIVLWNALVLHARWDGLVKDRGLAILAVVGNITTSWSWFGVNQLGVGLHNYGFNQELMTLMTRIVGGSALIACMGMLPKSAWWSSEKLEGTA